MIGILHTTESDPGSGDAVNGYFLRNLNILPHVLVDPLTRQVWHYAEPGETTKALFNAPGGVETNRRTGGVYQVEIVGRAAEVGDYSDEWYQNLKSTLEDLSRGADLVYAFHEDPTRFSFAEWSGPLAPIWYRHSNVPENTHWDPGTLDYSRLTAALPAPDPEDPDMKLLDETTKGWTVNDILNWTIEGVNKINAKIDDALNVTPTVVGSADLTRVSTAALLAELVRRNGSV